LIHEHREESITYTTVHATVEQLLGSLQYGFPRPDLKLNLAEDAARLPLRELWEAWWHDRPAKLRDKDGLELLRAWIQPVFTLRLIGPRTRRWQESSS